MVLLKGQVGDAINLLQDSGSMRRQLLDEAGSFAHCLYAYSIKITVHVRVENGAFALAKLSRCYHFDD